MSTYSQFIFDSYSFNKNEKKLDLIYKFDDVLTFTETYHFDFDFVDYEEAKLNKAIQSLFVMAGVSYYKAYPGAEITLTQNFLSESEAAFFAKTYQKGLGEFFYVNKLDPNQQITFPASDNTKPQAAREPNQGLLIAVGGGKDSLVSIELLKDQPKVATWSLGHKAQLQPLVNRIGLPHLWVERTWDKQLLDLNNAGALNGHVPISAIFGMVGAVVAVLAGYGEVVVSNESSASEPNLMYEGTPINHQYSKSLEYEKDFQNYLATNLGGSVSYYSFLRPLTEVYISEIFARIGFDKYQDVYSSCNRAFVHSSDSMSWCGICAKCAFTFLALTPFVSQKKLENLWGKNLLRDPKLEPMYRQLLGIDDHKPLDCVGEVKESRAAMKLASKTYPELNEKYVFELPDNYDYRTLSEHSMPASMANILLGNLSS